MPTQEEIDGPRWDYLQSLDESQLRHVVLIPLLSQMGFQDVIEYHGPVERGKDIVCRYRDHADEFRYMAVVVKRNDIHGAVGRSGNAGEVILQIQQTFDEPYTDIFELKDVVIDECWVITSGVLRPTAVDSIRGILKKSNLDKLVKFVDRRKLCSLIDRYLPAFWRSDRHLLQILHDMRAPIHMVRASSDLLAHQIAGKKPLDSEMARRMVADINLQMVLLERMIRCNYLFATPSVDLHARPEDLMRLVSKVVQEVSAFHRRRQKSDREITLKASSQKAPCRVDSSAFSQAVWNLLDNALRYSPPNTPVTVEVRHNGDVYDILVSDIGIGIDPEIAGKVMEPHFRGRNAINTTAMGSGLGLTVADRVARAHGGSLVIQSCRNPTIVCLSLPKWSST